MMMIFIFGFTSKKIFAEIWHVLDWGAIQNVVPLKIFLCKTKIPFVTVYKGNLDFTKGNTLFSPKTSSRFSKMLFDLIDLHPKHPQNLYFFESIHVCPKPTEKNTSSAPARS